jgi:argininosuccinate lyase
VRGLPFREAHQIVGEIVRRCLATGRELSTLPLDEYRALSPLFDADVLDIDVSTSVGARDQVGGTAPNRVAAALGEARAWTAELQAWSAERRERIFQIGRILVETGVF